MAALNFPSSPTVGQIYTANGKSWQWNGTAWISYNQITALNGITIDNCVIGGTTPAAGTFTNLAYTGTLTGGTGVINIGSGQVYKDASGNLGLGVTPSGWANAKAMDIANYGSISTDLVNDANISVAWNAYATAYNAWKYKNTGSAASRYAQEAGKHYWFTAPSGTAGNAISFTQAMTLDASGRLNLGATSNAFGNQLYVSGSTYPAPLLGLYDTTANNRSGIGIYNNSFNCGIWLSGDYLQVTNSGSYTGTTVEFSVRASNGVIFSNYLTGGATTLSVDAYGNIIRTISDRNLKTNDKAIPYGLAEVNKMRPIIHEWTPEANMGDGKSIGFIAQEMEEIIPEVVSGEETKSLDYPKLVAVLTAAIQELSAELNELKAKVNA